MIRPLTTSNAVIKLPIKVMISKITDKIIPKALRWQNRPYPICFIDCVHVKVQTDNMVTKKAAYVVLGVNENGYKEIFGIWIRSVYKELHADHETGAADNK